LKEELNETNCPCCGEKWTSNQITGVQNDFTFFMKATYHLTYRLICKKCNISTRFSKVVKRKDFKPHCKTEQHSSLKVEHLKHD